MAQSTKGAGNLMVPLAVVTAVVVGLLVVTFTLTGEEPPDEPTVIAEDDVEAEPAGAGTRPEGAADETEEGITDQLDDVTPAAPGVETVPPADLATENGADPRIEGETEADEVTAGTADEPVVADEDVGEDAAGTGDAAALIEEETATPEGADEAEVPMDGTETGGEAGDASLFSDDEFLLEEGADTETAPEVVEPDRENFPAGRDAQVELDPDPDQDVVRDTDMGGTGFIPTPSGPEGRDDETIAD